MWDAVASLLSASQTTGKPIVHVSITNPRCQLESRHRTESKTSAENIWTRAIFNGHEWEVVFIMCFRKWQASYCWVTNDWQPVFTVNGLVQNSNNLKTSLSLCSVLVTQLSVWLLDEVQLQMRSLYWVSFIITSILLFILYHLNIQKKSHSFWNIYYIFAPLRCKNVHQKMRLAEKERLNHKKK